MGDRWFAQLPAQQEDFSFYLAGEVQQSDVEIFHLNSGRVDFGERILNAANRPLALRLAPGQMHHIQQHAAIEKNLVRGLLQFGVHVFNQLLGVDCLPEQRLQNWEQRLRFIEAKSAVGHWSLFYWTSRKEG